MILKQLGKLKLWKWPLLNGSPEKQHSLITLLQFGYERIYFKGEKSWEKTGPSYFQQKMESFSSNKKYDIKAFVINI